MTTTFRLIEGFDVYPNINSTSAGLQARWLSVGNYGAMGLTTGRFGGQALVSGPSSSGSPAVAYPLTIENEGDSGVALGFAFNLQISVTQQRIATLRTGGATGTDVCGIAVNNSQQPYIFGSSVSTPLATASLALSTGSWHYFELVANLVSSGSLTLYVDGVEACTYSGALTNTVDSLVFGTFTPSSSAGLGYFDDVYSTASATRLGERRVETLYPDAAGADSGWTPLSGANYANVNSTINNNGSTYVSTSTANEQDLYEIGPLSGQPSIIDAVQVRVSCAKSDSASHVLTTSLQSDGNLVQGSNFAIAGTYLYDLDIHTLDPNGSIAWTYAAVNACQIGQKLVS